MHQNLLLSKTKVVLDNYCLEFFLFRTVHFKISDIFSRVRKNLPEDFAYTLQ